jgi:hypothetical protein
MAKTPKATTKPVPVSATPEALLERFKDYPSIDIIERRFNDPNDPGSLPILLADESANACVNSDHQYKLKPGASTCHLCKRPARKWHVRYVNTQWEGRWANVKAKGYIAVEVKDLKDEQDIADLVRQKEATGAVFVRRGDRGQEILCKMPLELHNYIKTRQREVRNADMRSVAKVKESLAEAAGKDLGDEAGQTIHDGGIMVESMKHSRTTVAEEAEAGDE